MSGTLIRKIDLFLWHLDPLKPPTQFKVSCPKNGTMADLCLALSKLAEVPAESLVVTDVYNHRFHKIYTREDQLSQILDRDDIFVYQMDISNPDLVTVPIYLRERKTGSTYSPTNLFGQPLLASLPQSCTVLELYNALLLRMSRYVIRPQEEDEWWKPDPAASMEQDATTATVTETETTNGNDDDDMLSDEEEVQGPLKIFSLHLVNSYGNAQLEPIDSTAGR